MKLYVPEPEIGENSGFLPQVDIFQRKDFGERLANLVLSCGNGIVLALDAQWGEGKSTFIKMWRGHIAYHREEQIHSIYFDAFANDYQRDPFLAIAAELYDLARDESKEKREEFKEKASNVAKSLARGAIKIGVRTVTGGLIDGSVLDSAEKDIATLLANEVDSLIASRLQDTKKDRLAIVEFRKFLEEFVSKKSNGVPIVFVIDELDRCRPDFALELLEQIKHLFSVDGLVFLLVLNRKSLEETIRVRYGADIGSTQYLQKFVNLWLSLPRKSDRYQDQAERYIEYCLRGMLDQGEQYQNGDAAKFLSEVARVRRLSCREIERILTYFALVHNMSKSSLFYPAYQVLMAFVCYLKVAKPDLIERVLADSIDSRDLMASSELRVPRDNNGYSYIEFLGRLVKFDLANEETRSKMVQEKEFTSDDFGRAGTDMLKSISHWLATISRQ